MANEPASPRTVREPSYFDAIIPLAVLALLIGGSVTLFGLAAMDGPLQVSLILSAMVASGLILKNGHTWDEIADAGRKGVSSVVSAIFILFAVGALIGTWNMAGTIPTMIHYGMQMLDANWFYLATAVICGAIAIGIGSSWTTAGTIGVGLVGLSQLIGVSPAVTAGAVISGAYLGDKLSPLSETTILAAQLTGNDVYTHLRAQVWTSVPAFILALIVFTILGLHDSGGRFTDAVLTSELDYIDSLFWITPINLLPLALLIVLSALKFPASLAIMIAALAAGILAPFTQPEAVLRFVNDPTLPMPIAAIKGIWMAIATGYEANSGVPLVDQLLSRGGMNSMLLTIWLIIGALAFGTLLDEFGLLSKLVNPVLHRARSTGQLIATVAGTALGLNIIAGDQYVALVLPIRIFRVEFEKRGLNGASLSRTVADAGTVTSPLVPWNSCGAYMAAVLGVSTLVYMPFAVFNIASLLLTVIYGFANFKIVRNTPTTPTHPIDAPHGLMGGRP